MENLNTPPAGTPPDNNLVWAIICTVLCCLPLGIVSIIKSTKVKELWLQGHHAEAQKAADDAKKWAIWGMIIGPVLYIIIWVIYFFAIAGMAAAGSY